MVVECTVPELHQRHAQMLFDLALLRKVTKKKMLAARDDLKAAALPDRFFVTFKMVKINTSN